MNSRSTNTTLKILWLSPNLNHYKARFLNHLAKEVDIDLTILSGAGREAMGDAQIDEDWVFQHKKLNVLKKKFGTSKLVRESLKVYFNKYDWILIPAEKKNLLLFLYANLLKSKSSKTKLFSYNHPILKSGNGKISYLDRLLTKFYYRKLDRVVFYTEQSCKWALQNNLIEPSKAFWANNTIDTNEIDENYIFQLPPENKPNILFIGRLIATKRIQDLMSYYKELKSHIPNLTLDIIGDGPENSLIKKAAETDLDITWHGTLVNEVDIAPIMKKTTLVFIPGHSGLSINHAFAYGRPYITLNGPSHAPELDYIDSGINGYVLDDDINTNISILKKLLLNRNMLEGFCENAKVKGEYLAVKNWVNQFKLSLQYD
ncbi:glycosyltransferase family 4 protein [Hanstruepera ponticola]|uniref:glycosyltransferase family 4 protein n=1 Tax=Hanstruepera ponticola TaxID=2042995 RepID=UPI001784EADB|nr:glycosyltransferase family 4 protein [Hanstruepera ponticola]